MGVQRRLKVTLRCTLPKRVHVYSTQTKRTIQCFFNDATVGGIGGTRAAGAAEAAGAVDVLAVAAVLI